MAENNSSALAFSAFIIIGGLLGILSVFLAWIDFGGLFTMSGWEIIQNSIESPSLSTLEDDYFKWMPLVVLIFGALGLLLGISAIAKPNKVAGGGAAFCGILMIIAVIVYMMYSIAPNVILMEYSGIGTFLAGGAGTLLLIFGLLRR
jgi:hypothetical protein